MLDKLKKISRTYKYRRQLFLYLKSLSHEECLDDILNKFNINKLPVIEISDLLELYSYKSDCRIKIKTDFSEGISPINDYYFICLIAKAINVKNYFEFGTWVGLSGYNVASNLGQDAEIYSLDIPADHREIAEYKIPIEIFGHYSKDFKNVHLIKSDSKNFDFTAYKKQIDLVFVDGNHSFDYVKNDTKIALELLRDENSVIIWHDYFLGGELNKKVLAGILDELPESEYKHVFHLYQSNIALYSRAYSFRNRDFDKWNIPEQNFNITIELSGI